SPLNPSFSTTAAKTAAVRRSQALPSSSGRPCFFLLQESQLLLPRPRRVSSWYSSAPSRSCRRPSGTQPPSSSSGRRRFFQPTTFSSFEFREQKLNQEKNLRLRRSVIDELKQIKVVNMRSRELVLDLLQSVVEIITYGDKHDPSILDENSRIEAPLLQYLSIMIQNMDNEHAIYYCFSNGYINSIILHPTVSGKINRDTLCLLVNVHGDVVVSFPLYTEALRFSHHEEKMIQTAVRTIALNIYNVSDEMVYKFIMTPPVSDYFSVMVGRLREMCIPLDAFLHEKR
ncbi:hypothetical protein S245_008494, partial [Arachis hypogaea]